MFEIIFYIVCLLISIMIAIKLFWDKYIFLGFVAIVNVLLCLLMVWLSTITN